MQTNELQRNDIQILPEIAEQIEKTYQKVPHPYNVDDPDDACIEILEGPFRGVIVDVDPEFSNTEEWYQSIPAEIRPSRNQPYYHLMAENTETFYTAYVSQQNLVDDGENGPLEHPDLDEIFSGMKKGKYHLRNEVRN